jgi:hypothetical protein
VQTNFNKFTYLVSANPLNDALPFDVRIEIQNAIVFLLSYAKPNTIPVMPTSGKSDYFLHSFAFREIRNNEFAG